MYREPEERHGFPFIPVWLILFVSGLGIWIFALAGIDAGRAWQAFLVNFLFFTPLSAGLVVWTAIVLASRGAWMGESENLAALGQGFAVPSLLVLLALWGGSSGWAPWPHLDPHQGLWLKTPFVLGRDVVALAVFWGVAFWYRRHRRVLNDKGAAAVLILVYCLVFSLLGFDLVMGLDPEWVSALFGGYFFVSGLYIAMAALALMAAWQVGVPADRLHDIGKLLLAFSILTTYTLYSQLLPIYYENLPHETRFLVPRMNFQPWATVSAVLLAVVFIGPLVLLLTIRAKRNRAWLGSVAALILIGMWVERWWLVAPTLGRPMQIGFPEVGAALLYVGLLGISLLLFAPRRASTAVGGISEQ